jgi:hypothetical protein
MKDISSATMEPVYQVSGSVIMMMIARIIQMKPASVLLLIGLVKRGTLNVIMGDVFPTVGCVTVMLTVSTKRMRI